MVDVAHHKAVVNGVRLHYVVGGTGNAVVLLHGWPQTWHAWWHVIVRLAGRYTVIAPDRRVTVNAVAPGTTDTEMLRAGLPEQAKMHMIANTTLGRLGTPEDIADVVAFLCSADGR